MQSPFATWASETQVPELSSGAWGTHYRKIQMVTEPKHILLTWDAGIPRYILTATPNAHPRFYAITTEVIYLLIPFVVIKFLKYPHAKLLLFPLICSAAPKFMIQDIR